MTSMTTTAGAVTGGVDTHGDTNHAAVLDGLGKQLGDRGLPRTPNGYRQLLAWLSSFGPISNVGIEGTGSYGAGLAPTCTWPGLHWWRSIGPTVKFVAAKASPILWMPTPPHGRHCPVPRQGQ